VGHANQKAHGRQPSAKLQALPISPNHPDAVIAPLLHGHLDLVGGSFGVGRGSAVSLHQRLDHHLTIVGAFDGHVADLVAYVQHHLALHPEGPIDLTGGLDAPTARHVRNAGRAAFLANPRVEQSTGGSQ